MTAHSTANSSDTEAELHTVKRKIKKQVFHCQLVLWASPEDYRGRVEKAPPV